MSLKKEREREREGKRERDPVSTTHFIFLGGGNIVDGKWKARRKDPHLTG